MMCALRPYDASSGSAIAALSVYDAASVASPCDQAAKNAADVSRTSSPLGGPLRRTGAGSPTSTPPPSPFNAVTMLYAPYPAPPIITANTEPTIAPLTPLRIPRALPVSPPAVPRTVSGPSEPCA
ncbi:hypothetical protein GCM10020256_45220 [Streptomyces thermocoprophilus]